MEKLLIEKKYQKIKEAEEARIQELEKQKAELEEASLGVSRKFLYCRNLLVKKQRRQKRKIARKKL